MKIIEKSYLWNGKLSKRISTDFIVLHHAAASKCSPDSIHRIHIQNNGWTGIGYHFYVRKDGSIYTGRPLDTKGSHVENHNSRCLGVCFEGNFEKEQMPDAQLKSGQELLTYLMGIYPHTKVKKHCDFNNTACPGRYFPFDKICSIEITDAKEIVNILNKRGIMTNASLWMAKCTNDANAYWLARKLCNMTKNTTTRARVLESVNDIVWELSHRGIITDKALWLRLFEKDKDLYWLGYKTANITKNN